MLRAIASGIRRVTTQPARHCRVRGLAVAVIAALLGGCAQPAPPGPAAPVVAAAPAMPRPVPVPRPNAANAVAPTESPIAGLMRLLDRNGDGRISQQEHAAGASRTFDAMDADGDGTVTAAEMDATRRGLYGADRTAAAGEIATVDGNGDGVLTAAEHTTATRVMFDRIDADRDGALTAQELEAAATPTR